MKHSLRSISGLLSLLLLAACHGGSSNGLPPPSGSGAAPAPAIPKLADVGKGTDVAGKPATESAWTGSLYARYEAQLGPKMSGILAQVAVEEGDRVKKGQMLFRLDSGQASLGVDQAKAALSSAQVGYEAAKLEFSRASELIKGGSISPAAYDQAKAGFDRATTGLEQAKVAVAQAQRGLTDSSVVSPIDGVVTAKLKSVGETVTMMPPTTVLVVQDIDKLELRARLPERALAVIKEGGSIRMTVASISLSRDVPVKRINPTIDPRTRTVEVIADVDNSDGKLKVGMLVEVAPSGTPEPKSAKTETGSPSAVMP